MVTVQVLLRVSLFVLMLVDVHGRPVKGSKSQGRPGDSGEGDHGGSQQGSATGYSSPGFYRTPGAVSKPGKAVEQYLGPSQYVQAQPVPVMLSSSMPGPGYATSSGSLDPLQGGSVAGSYLPVQAGSLVPLPAAYAASPQSGSQATLPEMEWVIRPQAFEEASANNQPEGLSLVDPALPPAPPSLQSGETSNVVKEAELGNYQQQTEEFGYPATSMGPGPGLPQVALPGLGVGGLWGYPSPYPLPYPFPYPYPEFDYRLLYGLYPPGTYTTFSKDHEKGKDYYQTIHYLKEHESDDPETTQNPGTGQQKVFPGVLQRT